MIMYQAAEAASIVAGVQCSKLELPVISRRRHNAEFHNVLSTRLRRRRFHGYGDGFLALSRDSTTPSGSSNSSSRWLLLRREAVRIIDGAGRVGFQAEIRGSANWNAGALAAVGNGRYERCQATKKGHGRGVVQQQKSSERQEDGNGKLKDKQGSKYKEEETQRVVGFAGLASLKAQLQHPQASVAGLTKNTVEQEQIARKSFNRGVSKSIQTLNTSKAEVKPPSIQSSQSNHQVAINKGGSPAALKSDDQNSFKEGKKVSVVIRTGETFATDKSSVTAAAAEKQMKTLSEGHSTYGAGSGEYERGSSKGAAILAAMQKAAALDRAKASQRRKTGVDNLHYKEDGQRKEEGPEEAPPKPIVLKPEWNDQIQSLERLVHDLKQARYD